MKDVIKFKRNDKVFACKKWKPVRRVPDEYDYDEVDAALGLTGNVQRVITLCRGRDDEKVKCAEVHFKSYPCKSKLAPKSDLNGCSIYVPLEVLKHSTPNNLGAFKGKE